MSRVLGLDFSLCKQDEEDDQFAYPRDECLEEYIRSYFSDLSEKRINRPQDAESLAV